LTQHIRKYPRDKGLLIREFGEEIRIDKFTVINWEVRGRRLLRNRNAVGPSHVIEIHGISSL
jgi:hypothetical protein